MGIDKIIKSRKPIIVGLSSTILKNYEKKYLINNKPWGVILFARNIKYINQAKNLVLQIKSCFKDPYYPILIDEEGGRVSRLKKIVDTKIFSAEFFSKLYKKDKKKFILYYNIYINSISSILSAIGININTVPVLDVKRNKTNKIIGDRSFSNNPKVVSKLAKYCIDLYSKNKIATVMKHIPGHGLSKVDSHIGTPIVDESKKILNNIDFTTFKNKNTFLAMTAHVIFKSYDANNTATHSKKIIQKLIRGKINYKNIIISDDISMKSLQFSFKNNVLKAFHAGCNLVLHCNGKINEMNKLAEISPNIDNFTIKKTSQLYKFLM